MNRRLLSNLLLLFAMGLGLFTGWLDVPVLNSAASITSDLFLRLLKLISLPIIFLAVTSTITGMRDLKEMRLLGRKVITYTLATTILAATVALTLFLIINPASTVTGLDGQAMPEVPQQSGSYLSFVLNIVPSNIIEVFAQGNVIGIVFIALILSMAVLFLPEEQKSFLHNLFSSLFGAMIKVTGFIIKLMPLAIWAFMALLIKDLQSNYAHFNKLMLYILCVVGANVIQGVVVLPLMLKFKKISPIRTFKGMAPALTMAFFSKSSNATLPLTMRSVQNNLGVSRRVSNFSLPLCSVVNMNGCAAFILVTTLFVSMLNGITFGPFELIGWIFVATLAAVGNAGVPMGCFFLSSAFLVGMDVPLYMMGLILPFYTIIDMIETALNVWSDACITVTVDKDLALAGAGDITPTTDSAQPVE